MWKPDELVPWGMFALGVLLLISILFRRAARYYRKVPRSYTSSRHTVATTRTSAAQPLVDAPPELLRWQVEMHETARDLKGELDSKMVALQELIRQAELQAERLRATIEEAKQTRDESGS